MWIRIRCGWYSSEVKYLWISKNCIVTRQFTPKCIHRIASTIHSIHNWPVFLECIHRIWFSEWIPFDPVWHHFPLGALYEWISTTITAYHHRHRHQAGTRQAVVCVAAELWEPGHICCMHEFNNIMHALLESNIILKRLAGIMLNRAIILLSAFPSLYVQCEYNMVNADACCNPLCMRVCVCVYVCNGVAYTTQPITLY